MFSNEDVTIGSWMLAMNVDHEHDHALCETECTSSFIAVWDIPKCSGWYCWSPFSFFFSWKISCQRFSLHFILIHMCFISKEVCDDRTKPDYLIQSRLHIREN